MPAVTAIQLDDRLVRPAAGHKVYLRAEWSGDWTETPHLYCDYVVFAASPSVGTASFHRRYGVGLQPGASAFAEVPARQDLLEQFVKVEIDSPPDSDGNPQDPVRWYGRFLELERTSDGAFVRVERGGEERTASGVEAITAYSLEVLLDRQEIHSAWWRPVGSPDEKEIGRALQPNARNRLADEGNRSHAVGPRGVYLFAGDVGQPGTTCDWWSTRDLAEYLVTYHGPVDELGNTPVPIKLADDCKPFLPTFDRPMIRLEGQTVKRALDELLDRRRLLGWSLRVTPGTGSLGEDELEVYAFNYLDEDLELPDGNTLLGNPSLRMIDPDAAPDVLGQVTRLSASQRYDLVEALGNRIVCCGCMADDDATMVEHWTDDEQTWYDAGASFAAGWATPNIDVKEKLNADARAVDRLARVYSHFGLPDDWDGKVGNGRGGTKVYLFPFTELNLDPNTTEVWYPPELEFRRHLPLEANPHAAGNPKWEFRPTWGVIRSRDPNTPPGTWWIELDKLGNQTDAERTGEGAGRCWTVSVRVQDQAAAVSLKVSGAPQHVIAHGDFVGNEADRRVYGDWTWREMIVVFAMEAQRRVAGYWPADDQGNPDPAENEVLRVLSIDVRDAELWYVAPGTPTEVRATTGNVGVLADHAGGFVRDDRDRLRQLARLAYEWYGVQRRALALTIGGIVADVQVGDLITEIGGQGTAEAVRSVVTNLRYDLAKAEGETDRTTIQTQWAELDVLRML